MGQTKRYQPKMMTGSIHINEMTNSIFKPMAIEGQGFMKWYCRWFDHKFKSIKLIDRDIEYDVCERCNSQMFDGFADYMIVRKHNIAKRIREQLEEKLWKRGLADAGN